MADPDSVQRPFKRLARPSKDIGDLRGDELRWAVLMKYMENM